MTFRWMWRAWQTSSDQKRRPVVRRTGPYCLFFARYWNVHDQWNAQDRNRNLNMRRYREWWAARVSIPAPWD